jgi:chromosome segregation protein
MQTQQRLQGEMRHGLEQVLRYSEAAQRTEAARHADALEAERTTGQRTLEDERMAAAAKLTRVQEERGAALLRAEQSEAEAVQLREMLGQLKRQDDALYAAQSSSATELKQLRAALAAAEERVAAGRVALEEEGARRLEAERQVRVARSERDGMRTKKAAADGAQAELAALKAGSSTALAQYKEDNAVLAAESQAALQTLCADLREAATARSTHLSSQLVERDALTTARAKRPRPLGEEALYKYPTRHGGTTLQRQALVVWKPFPG